MIADYTVVAWLLNVLSVIMCYWPALSIILVLKIIIFVLRIGFIREIQLQAMIDKYKSKDWRYDG